MPGAGCAPGGTAQQCTGEVRHAVASRLESTTHGGYAVSDSSHGNVHRDRMQTGGWQRLADTDGLSRPGNEHSRQDTKLESGSVAECLPGACMALGSNPQHNKLAHL